MTFKEFAMTVYGIQLTAYQADFLDFMEWCKKNKRTLPFDCTRGALLNLTYRQYKKEKN